ncbi:tetratricopeptide repeat protein [Candidatus Woesebacteria bacterium]|nr:tetratricopeptide repeat protein [Candidatus Woesebacteria bacterium]
MIDPVYLIKAKEILTSLVPLAPNDPKILYSLGVIEARLGEFDNSIKDFDKAIELKQNYKDPHYSKALILIQLKQRGKAINELEFILKNINPEDELIKAQLEKLKS